MIIAIDFDGTIARTHFPDIFGQMPLAKEAMEQLKKEGHYIIVWTSRQGKDLLAAVNWMLEEGIPFDRINAEAPATIEQYGERECGKIYADMYIDDNNFGGFRGWPAVMAEVVPPDGNPYDGCMGM